MKKLKRKAPVTGRNASPVFVIGYTNAEAPPAGFLTAWFNETFKEQLNIAFPTARGTTTFHASMHNHKAHINTAVSPEAAKAWQERLEWIHSQAAEIVAPKSSSARGHDQVLFLARLARGLAELTDGTAYDVGTGTYINPSDWITQSLDHFDLTDHIRIEQVDRPNAGNVWFHTRGLGKFGFEEIEVYKHTGLSAQPVIQALENIADSIILRGKPLRGGDSFAIDSTGQSAEIVRHRTDQSYGIQLNLREVVWD